MEERDVFPGSVLFVHFSLAHGNTEPGPEALSNARLPCAWGQASDTSSSVNAIREHMSKDPAELTGLSGLELPLQSSGLRHIALAGAR